LVRQAAAFTHTNCTYPSNTDTIHTHTHIERERERERAREREREREQERERESKRERESRWWDTARPSDGGCVNDDAMRRFFAGALGNQSVYNPYTILYIILYYIILYDI
jgi:hypothetical protein